MNWMQEFIMSDWKEYIDDRLIMHHDKFSVIKPKKTNDVIPISCNVCDFLYTNNDDVVSHEKFKCCASCANRWAYANSEKWSEGWRPNAYEIKHEVSQRIHRRIIIE